MQNWILRVLSHLLLMATPKLKDAIVKSVLEWEIAAKETKTPFDDLLVDVLKGLLGIN